MSRYERDRCNQDEGPSNDSRYCRECLSKPCRWLDGKPAPSPQPEMPYGWDSYVGEDGRVRFFTHHVMRGFTVETVRALLATQGLTIVGPAERAVLDAVREGALDNPGGVLAELAQRLLQAEEER